MKFDPYGEKEWEYTEPNINLDHPQRRWKTPKEQGAALDLFANRKDYRDFKPWPNENDGSPQYSGKDRIYAFHQFARENPSLDFAKMIRNDRAYFPNVEVPTELEFANNKFSFNPDYKSGEEWQKNDKGEWEHVSTGTGAGYWDKIYELLMKEDLI